MADGSRGTGRRWGAVALAIAGVIVLVLSLFVPVFSCFMVTDEACTREAASNAALYVLFGTGLMLASIWVCIRRD